MDSRKLFNSTSPRVQDVNQEPTPYAEVTTLSWEGLGCYPGPEFSERLCRGQSFLDQRFHNDCVEASILKWLMNTSVQLNTVS